MLSAKRAGYRIGERWFCLGVCRAGITNLQSHHPRHTDAAWSVSNGVPLPKVLDLLGHSTVTMTEKYAFRASDNVRAAIAILDGSTSCSRYVGYQNAT